MFKLFLVRVSVEKGEGGERERDPSCSNFKPALKSPPNLDTKTRAETHRNFNHERAFP